MNVNPKLPTLYMGDYLNNYIQASLIQLTMQILSPMNETASDSIYTEMHTFKIKYYNVN